MMRKVVSLFFALCALLWAESKTIPQGWSLNGVGINEASVSVKNFSDDVSSIWKYVDGSWQAYSPEPTTQTLIKNANIPTLQSIDAGEGFWINALKQTTYSASVNSKIVTGEYESTSDATMDSYTYNYTTSAGIIQSDRINWSDAGSLSDTNLTEIDGLLARTIAQVFFSSNSKTALIVQSQNCNEDITIALTPYSSFSTIPGINNYIAKTVSSGFVPTTTSKSSNDTNLSVSLTAYTSTDKEMDIIKEFSSDISVRRSNTKRVPVGEIDTLCPSIELSMVFKKRDAYDADAKYQIHTISGYDDIQTSDINLTKNSTSVSLQGYPKNLKPFFITKEKTSTLTKDSTLRVNYNQSQLFSSTIDANISMDDLTLTTDTDGNSITNQTDLQSKITSLGYDIYTPKYHFIIAHNTQAMSQYINPSFTSTTAMLFAYDESISTWVRLTTNILRLKAKEFVILSAKKEDQNTTPTSTSSLVLFKTGQTTSYTDFDDGYYQKGATPSYTRDATNDTVTDNITGLMWQDDTAVATVTKQWLTNANYTTCSNDTSSSACDDTSGDTAATYCSDLTLGGYTDWRLPTATELEGIVDYGKAYPSIDTAYFNNSGSSVYWSSTSVKGYEVNAWIVYFDDGFVGYYFKDNNLYVRCVRDGQ